jgi:biopolymer transport protein ExbB/TolQ
MARGWESKSVESQMDAAEERRSVAKRAALTAEQAARLRQREGLELSKVRVLRELKESVHARHREQLKAALAYLDQQLTALG